MSAVTRITVEGFDEVHRIECAGAVAFVALHAAIGGRAFGGIRVREYPGEREALGDALLLARAMSRKVVLTGIEGGGGKTVLIAPKRDRARALEELGRFVDSLGGRYRCGPDFGFTAADSEALRGATTYFATGDLSPYTARTVLLAMRAVVEPSVVAIQGLGAIGRPLATMLTQGGARVIGSDIAPVPGFERVAPEAIYDVACDVFAPCALGGVLDEQTIARLRCRVVCGGANNPLASEADAERLRARGITYVPDFIANSGATIHGASTMIGEVDHIEARLASVATLTREVVERAAREGRSPHAVAVEMADAIIAAKRAVNR
jgi:leucine dehydrogenase